MYQQDPTGEKTSHLDTLRTSLSPGSHGARVKKMKKKAKCSKFCASVLVKLTGTPITIGWGASQLEHIVPPAPPHVSCDEGVK